MEFAAWIGCPSDQCGRVQGITLSPLEPCPTVGSVLWEEGGRESHWYIAPRADTMALGGTRDGEALEDRRGCSQDRVGRCRWTSGRDCIGRGWKTHFEETALGKEVGQRESGPRLPWG